MLEHVHDEYGAEESQYVGDEWGVKVHFAVSIQAEIESKQESNENARDDDVAEAEQSKLLTVDAVLDEILRKDQFDWSVKWLGNADHDIGAKHPEDVVEEEAAQKDATVWDLV